MSRFFVFLVILLVRTVKAVCRSRAELVLENLALRQQVCVLKQRRPRPRLDDAIRGFWVALRASWPRWRSRLLLVKPATVVAWHRRGSRRYWTRLSLRGRRPGRPRVGGELRHLIRKLAADNAWGAPRIHGELRKLGFDVSEATVSRYLPRRPASPEQLQRWTTFLRNHRDGIAAMDLFIVPTVTMRLLYGFFVIDHGRRRILHFNATFHPTASWVVQQLREAFPFDAAPRYLIFDRDSIFSAAVVAFIQTLCTKPCRTSFLSPWQNPVAERWVGNCRRELLDHVVVFGARHLVRLVRSYLSYYHTDRTHIGLAKDTPATRPVTPRPSPSAEVVALPRVGGLHHRYEWRDAA